MMMKILRLYSILSVRPSVRLSVDQLVLSKQIKISKSMERLGLTVVRQRKAGWGHSKGSQAVASCFCCCCLVMLLLLFLNCCVYAL